MHILEKDIQSAILKYLRGRNISVSVTDASRVWGQGGQLMRSKVSKDHPDLSCVLSVGVKLGSKDTYIGLAFFIEVKSATGRIRDGQKNKLVELADSGAVCMIARSVEDVKAVVDKFQWRPLKEQDLEDAYTLLISQLEPKRKKKVSTQTLPF